jgi:hypothetical protein
MLLAQGRYCRVSLTRKGGAVALALDREELPEDLQEVKDLRMEVPLDRWNSVVKHIDSSRKLLGGILLDHASPKEHVARVIASDRLLAELQRVVRDATVALVEAGALVLVPSSVGED